MFARRPLAATPAPLRGAGPGASGILARPWAMPVAAAALLALSVGLFVLVTANPPAGAPSVKVRSLIHLWRSRRSG